jgi:hypothetical protein
MLQIVSFSRNDAAARSKGYFMILIFRKHHGHPPAILMTGRPAATDVSRLFLQRGRHRWLSLRVEAIAPAKTVATNKNRCH